MLSYNDVSFISLLDEKVFLFFYQPRSFLNALGGDSVELSLSLNLIEIQILFNIISF